MVQANELKLYNWIKVRGKIIELDMREFGRLFKNSNADDLNYLEGIPLTSEILENAGFEIFPFQECLEGFPFAIDIDQIEYKMLEFNIGQITYYEKENKFYISKDHSPDYYGAEVNLNFVHQLQNLYFALTGQELKIKDLKTAV